MAQYNTQDTATLDRAAKFIVTGSQKKRFLMGNSTTQYQ